MHHKHECGCEHHTRQGHGGVPNHHESGGCCCSGGFTGRHFHTREEMMSHLEKYIEQLKAEIKGVEEHISHLKSTDKED